jgi:hypothetical protein
VIGMLGEDILRRRVRTRCGDAGDVFGSYGHKFGRWLDAKPDGPSDRELTEVQHAVTEYLGGAVREGRRWGRFVGLTVGTVGAVLAFALIWAVA